MTTWNVRIVDHGTEAPAKRLATRHLARPPMVRRGHWRRIGRPRVDCSMGCRRARKLCLRPVTRLRRLADRLDQQGEPIRAATLRCRADQWREMLAETRVLR